MKRVIVVGGGWSGVSAAICAKKAGADVILIEKTDLLLGAGNVGGIYRNNGRFTAAEEMIALGAGELFQAMDSCAEHVGIEFPGHRHASLYNVDRIEPVVRHLVLDFGIDVRLTTHVCDVICKDSRISAVVLNDASHVEGDVFIDATGSSGPMGNCLRYGNGCSMCIQRCPTYGPRVSLSAKCGVKDLVGRRADGTYGVFSGACKISKSSLSDSVRETLEKDGVVVLSIPKEDIDYDKLKRKACKQYALKEYSENIILLDTGTAKLMTSYYPIDKLHRIEGLEKAHYIDPYSAGRGNSIRYMAVAPCVDTMQVKGVDNLFGAGEKGAPLIGHTEAIVTGAVAGYNAVQYINDSELLTIPDSLAVGLIISHSHKNFVEQGKYDERYTFSGGTFFTLMQDRSLYETDKDKIRDRVERLGLTNVFNGKVKAYN